MEATFSAAWRGAGASRHHAQPRYSLKEKEPLLKARAPTHRTKSSAPVISLASQSRDPSFSDTNKNLFVVRVYEGMDPCATPPISSRRLVTVPNGPMGPPPPLPSELSKRYRSVSVVVPQSLPEGFKANPFVPIPDTLIGLGHPCHQPYASSCIGAVPPAERETLKAKRRRKRRRCLRRRASLSCFTATNGRRKLLCGTATPRATVLDSASTSGPFSPSPSSLGGSKECLLAKARRVLQDLLPQTASSDDPYRSPWYCNRAGAETRSVSRAQSAPPMGATKALVLPRRRSLGDSNLSLEQYFFPTLSVPKQEFFDLVAASRRQAEVDSSSKLSLPSEVSPRELQFQENAKSDMMDGAFSSTTTAPTPPCVDGRAPSSKVLLRTRHQSKVSVSYSSTSSCSPSLASSIVQKLAEEKRTLQRKRMQLLMGTTASKSLAPSPLHHRSCEIPRKDVGLPRANRYRAPVIRTRKESCGAPPARGRSCVASCGTVPSAQKCWRYASQHRHPTGMVAGEPRSTTPAVGLCKSTTQLLAGRTSSRPRACTAVVSGSQSMSSTVYNSTASSTTRASESRVARLCLPLARNERSKALNRERRWTVKSQLQSSVQFQRPRQRRRVGLLPKRKMYPVSAPSLERLQRSPSMAAYASILTDSPPDPGLLREVRRASALVLAQMNRCH